MLCGTGLKRRAAKLCKMNARTQELEQLVQSMASDATECRAALDIMRQQPGHALAVLKIIWQLLSWTVGVAEHLVSQQSNRRSHCRNGHQLSQEGTTKDLNIMNWCCVSYLWHFYLMPAANTSSLSDMMHRCEHCMNLYCEGCMASLHVKPVEE